MVGLGVRMWSGALIPRSSITARAFLVWDSSGFGFPVHHMHAEIGVPRWTKL